MVMVNVVTSRLQAG